jgi:flagellar biosynthesis/type III secretory pathway protein FliH
MALRLESFDLADEAPRPGPSADWLAGHAEGLAQGIAEGVAQAEAEGAHLSRELAAALQDAAFSFAEARAQVLASLGPLVETIAARLLPALAAEAVGPWLRAEVERAARADAAQPVALQVHPSRLEAVRACLPPGAAQRLVADPALGPHEARLAFPARESALDLDACLAAIREALAALTEPQDQKARHG